MLKIALTGGIGSGKTEVTQYFRKLGVTVLDADEISHELTSKNKFILGRIADTFGKSVMNLDNSLSRKNLRELIFSDKAAKAQLEAILHPEIRRHMQEAANLLDTPYCIFSIPLLVETGQAQNFDRVLVVEASTNIRRQRIRRRSNLTDSDIDAVLTAQVSDAERRKSADDLVINDGSLNELFNEIERLHTCYIRLAKRQTSPSRTNIPG